LQVSFALVLFLAVTRHFSVYRHQCGVDFNGIDFCSSQVAINRFFSQKTNVKTQVSSGCVQVSERLNRCQVALGQRQIIWTYLARWFFVFLPNVVSSFTAPNRLVSVAFLNAMLLRVT
jgi:hypothetical protein